MTLRDLLRLPLRRRLADRAVWDSTEEQVLTMADELAAWRKAKPGDTPGQVEPDDAPAPDWISLAEQAGQAAYQAVAEAQARRPRGPRHRHHPALTEPTEEYREIVARVFGHRLTSVGPAEYTLRPSTYAEAT